MNCNVNTNLLTSRRALVAVLLLAVVMVPFLAKSLMDHSAAQESNPTVTMPAPMDTAQLALGEQLDALAEKVNALPDKTGFAGAEVDTPHRTLIVRWKGQVPVELTNLKSVATDAGVNMVIKPAVYSEAEIMTAGRLLMSTFKEQAWRPTLIHGTPSRDGLMLSVSAAALNVKSIEELTALYEKLTNMPVTVSVGDVVSGLALRH